MMRGYYYFNHGITHWVVQVLSITDGQALCQIDRVLEEWWNDRINAKWRHTQPHQGMEIELPMDMLRRCPRNLKMKRPNVRPEPFYWCGKLILAVCLVIAYFISVHGVQPVQDKTSSTLIAQVEQGFKDHASKDNFAHKKLGKLWPQWSTYYFQTGRSDNQLVDDCNFAGGPQLKTGTDTDCERLDRIEAEQN